MGIFKNSSYSRYDTSIGMFDRWLSESKIDDKVVNDDTKQQSLHNPKADNYKILRSCNINNYLIVEIKYLDCINYEGKKILVFENCTLHDLEKQKLIDPHFSENKNYFSPIVRFEPTEKGWNNALILCKHI